MCFCNLISDSFPVGLRCFDISQIKIGVIHGCFGPFFHLRIIVQVSLFIQVQGKFVIDSFTFLIFWNCSIKLIKKVRCKEVITCLSGSFSSSGGSLGERGFVGFKFAITRFGDWPYSEYGLIIEMFIDEGLNLFEFIFMFVTEMIFNE